MSDQVEKCFSRLGSDVCIQVRRQQMSSCGYATKYTPHSSLFYKDDRIGEESDAKTTITEIDATKIAEPLASITKSATHSK